MAKSLKFTRFNVIWDVRIRLIRNQIAVPGVSERAGFNVFTNTV